MLVGLADCCYRGGAASWPRHKLSRLTEMAWNPKIHSTFFSFESQNPSPSHESWHSSSHTGWSTTQSRWRWWIVLITGITPAGTLGFGTLYKWFKHIQTLVPTAVRFSVWCFRERVSLLGIPKCCPSSTIFVSAASLHHLRYMRRSQRHWMSQRKMNLKNCHHLILEIQVLLPAAVSDDPALCRH